MHGHSRLSVVDVEITVQFVLLRDAFALPKRDMADLRRFKLIFFAPPSSLERCKTAIFATGAGKYDKYTECCFTTPGIGQFRPSDDAKPVIGKANRLEEVGEVKCEIVCAGEQVTRQAVSALKK